MNKEKMDLPWILLDVAGLVYAISCKNVLSLNQLSTVTPLPVAPPEIRGVIDFRGHPIQLVDTKKLFNLKSSEEEIKDFSDMMDARLNDHINWLNTLEKCVKDNVDFTLTTDPHKCAFGKWYDGYNDNAKKSNLMFSITFARFDKPHKAIHQIGITAKELIEKNNKKAAIELIEEAKDSGLKQMLHLFDDLKEAYREGKKEIVVVIGHEDNSMSLSVDEIVAIEHLFEFDQDLIKNTMTNTEYLAGLAKRKNGNSVMLLNDEYLLETFLRKAQKV